MRASLMDTRILSTILCEKKEEEEEKRMKE